MKIAVAGLLLCLLAQAQPPPGPTVPFIYTLSSPSGGACIVGTSVNQIYVVTGALYTCAGASFGAAGTYTASGGGGGGGATIPSTTNLINGDGAGNGADSGIAPAAVGLKASPLNQFAPTTSAQLAGVISDETGSGSAVFGTSPTLITPALGTPSSVILTNGTGLPESGVVNLVSDLAALQSTNPIIPTGGLVAEYLFNWPNYVRYSQALQTTSYWTQSKLTGVNVGAGCSVSCIAPDGTNTGNEIVENSAAGQHYLQMGVTGTFPGAARSFVAGEVFTLTLFAKANTRSWLNVDIEESSGLADSYYDISGCALGSTTGANLAFLVSHTIASAANGWCKITISYTSNGSTDIYLIMASANGTSSYTGNGSNSLLLTEVQINAGASATAYTATTDLLTISDISGSGNNGTIAGTQATTVPNTSPQGLYLFPSASQAQRVELPAALTATMQTIVVVADVPTMDNNTYVSQPFFGSSAALGPKLLVNNQCANSSGVALANFNVRACWWFGTSGNPATTAGTAISAPQIPSGPQMVAVVMGAGAQDRIYINGFEYPYYNQLTVSPSSSAGVSRAGLSSAIPQIGADTSLSLYLPKVLGNTYGAKVYFAAVYNTQLTAEQMAGIYASVRTWLANQKGVQLGVSPANNQSANILLFLGDSQTQGYLIAGNSYPSIIINGTYPTAATFSVAKNLAIAGGLAATDANRGLANGVASIYQPNSQANVMTFMEGVNDVGTGCKTFTTAQQCANYVFSKNIQAIAPFKAAGFKTVAIPMLSAAGEGAGQVVVVSNVGTVVTFVKHGMSTGATVTVAASGNASLNGSYTITVDSPTQFHFTTSGVSNGTYGAAAMTITNVVMFDAIKNAFNTLMSTQARANGIDIVADVCSAAGYDPSLNSSATFSSLCADGAAQNNSQCNGVSCWQEHNSTTNLHPSTAGYLMMVQQVRNAIDRAYSGYNKILTGTTSAIGGGALTASCATGTATVTGALPPVAGALGNMVSSAAPRADITSGGTVAFSVSTVITAVNTVTVYVCGTGTPASVVYDVQVQQP